MTNNTITKASLANNVSEKLGISHSLSETIISSMFEGMVSILNSEEILKLQNFGTFRVHHKKERFGLNISRMKPVTISSRRVINFLSAKKTKLLINSQK